MIQQFFTRVSVEVGCLGRNLFKDFPLGKGLSCFVHYATTLKPPGMGIWKEILNEPYCFLLCKYESSVLLHWIRNTLFRCCCLLYDYGTCLFDAHILKRRRPQEEKRTENGFGEWKGEICVSYIYLSFKHFPSKHKRHKISHMNECRMCLL